jgi:hypothetical protein
MDSSGSGTGTRMSRWRVNDDHRYHVVPGLSDGGHGRGWGERMCRVVDITLPWLAGGAALFFTSLIVAFLLPGNSTAHVSRASLPGLPLPLTATARPRPPPHRLHPRSIASPSPSFSPRLPCGQLSEPVTNPIRLPWIQSICQGAGVSLICPLHPLGHWDCADFDCPAVTKPQ